MAFLLFFKTFCKRGKLFSLREGSGVNSILVTILRFYHHPEKKELLAWLHRFRLVRRIIFKKKCPKRTFRSDFVKSGSKIPKYVFLAEKWSLIVCLFVCLFVLLQYFVRFWLTFFKNEALFELRNSNMLLMKNDSMSSLRIA